MIDEALNEAVLVRENGRESMDSKRQVGARRFANKIAEGDFRTMALLLRSLGGIGVGADRRPAIVPAADPGELPPDGPDVFEELMAMARRAVAGDAGDAP